MTTQQANIIPKAPEDVAGLVMPKTIREYQADDLLEMTEQADSG
jgi:hypothetical protein